MVKEAILLHPAIAEASPAACWTASRREHQGLVKVCDGSDLTAAELRERPSAS
jgi:hypothetical protein